MSPTSPALKTRSAPLTLLEISSRFSIRSNRDHRRRARQLGPLHRQLPQDTLAKDHHTLSQMQVRVQYAVESSVQDGREHTCPWIDPLRHLEHRLHRQYVCRLVRGKAKDDIALGNLRHIAPHRRDHANASIPVAQRVPPLRLVSIHKQPRATVLFPPPHRCVPAIDVHLRPMTDARVQRPYRHFPRARFRKLILDQSYLSRPGDFCSLYLDHGFSDMPAICIVHRSSIVTLGSTLQTGCVDAFDSGASKIRPKSEKIPRTRQHHSMSFTTSKPNNCPRSSISSTQSP